MDWPVSSKRRANLASRLLLPRGGHPGAWLVRDVLGKRGDGGLDRACFWRLQLIAGTVVNGHGFVLRAYSLAWFGSAAAGWRRSRADGR